MSQGEENANAVATRRGPLQKHLLLHPVLLEKLGAGCTPWRGAPPRVRVPSAGRKAGAGAHGAARGERSSCVYFPSAGGNNRGFFFGFCFALFHFIFLFFFFFFFFRGFACPSPARNRHINIRPLRQARRGRTRPASPLRPPPPGPGGTGGIPLGWAGLARSDNAPRVPGTRDVGDRGCALVAAGLEERSPELRRDFGARAVPGQEARGGPEHLCQALISSSPGRRCCFNLSEGSGRSKTFSDGSHRAAPSPDCINAPGPVVSSSLGRDVPVLFAFIHPSATDPGGPLRVCPPGDPRLEHLRCGCPLDEHQSWGVPAAT
ncbi:uncharacterized protein [Anas platyrhynchos]|uniref:uncharacterized protein isoform X2 n=1 Tax=Anas platyrhynchos TaxID=8839 RepID=UPI003AF2214E